METGLNQAVEDMFYEAAHLGGFAARFAYAARLDTIRESMLCMH